MDEILAQELDGLKNHGLRRSLRTVSSRQGREVVLDGKKVLNFCSNDYLGLAGDLRVSAAAVRALEGQGFGAGAARLVCGNFDWHESLEQDIAAFKKTEAALVFQSGYMANVGIISALAGRDDVVFSDRLNHASIVDGIVLSRAEMKRYPHGDMAALEAMLAKEPKSRRKLIVTDTVFSMDGDLASLGPLADLAERYKAWLMVDEAHAFGVLGKSGAGLVEALGLEGRVSVQMGTLSKAAGCAGAYLAGSRVLCDYVMNKARSFVFTTAMPPSGAAAALEALRIIRAEPDRRARALASADNVRRELAGLGFDTLNSESPIIPVVAGESEQALCWSQFLLERGIFVSAIRPPTVPAGSARLRVTVTAAHTDEDVKQCVEAFRALARMRT